MNFFEECFKTHAHRHCAIDFVHFAGFRKRRFDNVAVVIVEFYIEFEDLGSRSGRQNVVNDKLAVGSEIITFLVQFFDSRFVLNFLVAR